MAVAVAVYCWPKAATILFIILLSLWLPLRFDSTSTGSCSCTQTLALPAAIDACMQAAKRTYCVAWVGRGSLQLPLARAAKRAEVVVQFPILSLQQRGKKDTHTHANGVSESCAACKIMAGITACVCVL